MKNLVIPLSHLALDRVRAFQKISPVPFTIVEPQWWRFKQPYAVVTDESVAAKIAEINNQAWLDAVW